jgi:hypothetical protein
LLIAGEGGGSKLLLNLVGSLQPLQHSLAPLRPHLGATRMFVRWSYYNMFVDFALGKEITQASKFEHKAKLYSFYDRTVHVRGGIYRAPTFVFYIK